MTHTLKGRGSKISRKRATKYRYVIHREKLLFSPFWEITEFCHKFVQQTETTRSLTKEFSEGNTSHGENITPLLNLKVITVIFLDKCL